MNFLLLFLWWAVRALLLVNHILPKNNYGFISAKQMSITHLIYFITFCSTVICSLVLLQHKSATQRKLNLWYISWAKRYHKTYKRTITFKIPLNQNLLIEFKATSFLPLTKFEVIIQAWKTGIEISSALWRYSLKLLSIASNSTWQFLSITWTYVLIKNN